MKVELMAVKTVEMMVGLMVEMKVGWKVGNLAD